MTSLWQKAHVFSTFALVQQSELCCNLFSMHLCGGMYVESEWASGRESECERKSGHDFWHGTKQPSELAICHSTHVAFPASLDKSPRDMVNRLKVIGRKRGWVHCFLHTWASDFNLWVGVIPINQANLSNWNRERQHNTRCLGRWRRHNNYASNRFHNLIAKTPLV